MKKEAEGEENAKQRSDPSYYLWAYLSTLVRLISQSRATVTVIYLLHVRVEKQAAALVSGNLFAAAVSTAVFPEGTAVPLPPAPSPGQFSGRALMLCVCKYERRKCCELLYTHISCYAHGAQSVKPVFLFSQLLYEHRLWLNASWNTNLFLALNGVIFRGAFCWTKIVKMTVKCKRKFASRPPCWFFPRI